MIKIEKLDFSSISFKSRIQLCLGTFFSLSSMFCEDKVITEKKIFQKYVLIPCNTLHAKIQTLKPLILWKIHERHRFFSDILWFLSFLLFDIFKIFDVIFSLWSMISDHVSILEFFPFQNYVPWPCPIPHAKNRTLKALHVVTISLFVENFVHRYINKYRYIYIYNHLVQLIILI